MRRQTYEWLCLLHARYGPREFGKLCQKLLAISFRQAGFPHVVERGVQGVDVDAANGQERYSTEVKTTLADIVFFQAKDLAGLIARQADGYHPLLGVLRVSPLSDWLLVDAENLRPGRLPIESLRPYRRRDQEDQIRPHFVCAVDEHVEAALVGAQGYLDRVLTQLGIERPPG